MKRYVVAKDSKRNVAVADLIYDEKKREFRISIHKEVPPKEMPFVFSAFASQGTYEIDPKWSARWVNERIVPAERQNIGQILRKYNMDRYDEMRLLELNHGRTIQDDFVVLPADDLLIQKRKGAHTANHKNRKPIVNSAKAFSSAEIRQLRQDLKMSQAVFASCLGVSKKTVEAWEGGKNHPDGAAQRILSMARNNPRIFHENGIITNVDG